MPYRTPYTRRFEFIVRIPSKGSHPRYAALRWPSVRSVTHRRRSAVGPGADASAFLACRRGCVGARRLLFEEAPQRGATHPSVDSVEPVLLARIDTCGAPGLHANAVLAKPEAGDARIPSVCSDVSTCERQRTDRPSTCAHRLLASDPSTSKCDAEAARPALPYPSISHHRLTAVQRDVAFRSGLHGVHVAIQMKETMMSKGRHGNKEAKKPKQAQPVPKPTSPASVAPAMTGVAPDRLKKKK